MSEIVFQVMSRPCDECLVSKKRIVTEDRANAILADIDASNHHFMCHKASAAGKNVACAGTEARNQSLAHRLALLWGSVRQVTLEELESSEIK